MVKHVLDGFAMQYLAWLTTVADPKGRPGRPKTILDFDPKCFYYFTFVVQIEKMAQQATCKH